MKKDNNLKDFILENKEQISNKICEALLFVLNNKKDGNIYEIKNPQ